MSTIKSKLVKLLETHRRESVDAFKGVLVHPVTLKPGFVPPDPYPPGAPDSVMDAFVRRTGATLPKDIQSWLAISDAPPGFLGIGASNGERIEDIWKLFPDWQRRGWLPVARDGFGNFYVRLGGESDKTSSAVCFVKGLSPERLVYVVATDTLHLAEFLLEEKSAINRDKTYMWPFDAGFVSSKDPGIKRVTVAPLPWSALGGK